MKTRNANLDLLRIISMVMIVCCHYITFADIFSTENIYFARIVFSSFLCCVDIFVLITGWFYGYNASVNLNDFKKAVYKSTNLWLITIFYTVSIFIIAVFCFKQPISLRLLVKSVFPISCKTYWFLSAYVFLLFLMPFLNCLINNISTKSHCILVLLILIFVSVPATFFQTNWLFDESEGYSIFWLVCLYIIGACLRRISDKIRQSKYIFLLCYLFCAAFTFLFFVIVRKICLEFGISDKSTIIFRQSSLPVLASGVFLLLFFAKINIKSSMLKKIIISVSSVTFDIYIIHCYEPVRNNLFINILHADKYYNSPLLLLHFAGSVLLIVFSTTIIGLIRKKLLDKPFKFISEKVSSLVDIIEKQFTMLLNIEKE